MIVDVVVVVVVVKLDAPSGCRKLADSGNQLQRDLPVIRFGVQVVVGDEEFQAIPFRD